MTGDTVPIAVRLAEYVATASSFPPEVVERARIAVLDTLGCMLGATQTGPGRLILGHVAGRSTEGASTVIGLHRARGATDAALANCTLAHMLELDDGHRPSDNHLGCVIVPTAIAVGEETGASAEACLEAIIVGYDVMGRVGESTCLPRKRNPFHGTGTTGVFGAAAVAARLHGLSADRAAHALAIAGTAAAGLRESAKTGPDCKPLHAGRASQQGIESAELAAIGYEGPLTIFEGRNGFCAATSSEPRPELISRDLGHRFAIQESGIKVHSTCGSLFTALDGVLDIRRLHGIDDPLPTGVRVSIPSWQLDDVAFSRRRPRTGAEAHFSIPFAVAAAIVDGEYSPRQLTPQKLKSPALAALEEIVELVPDNEVDAIFEQTKADPFYFSPAAVEIDHNGRTYRCVNRSPRGYDADRRPLTTEEVVRKFRSTVAGVVDDDTATTIADRALAFGEQSTVIELTAPVRHGIVDVEGSEA
jgi:2-methylcitrate dehydratase PrpD